MLALVSLYLRCFLSLQVHVRSRPNKNKAAVTVISDNAVVKTGAPKGQLWFVFTADSWAAAVITRRRGPRGDGRIRNGGSGEGFRLRLDQRTLQLWGGFGAHVCQHAWISLLAESHGPLLQPEMKGALSLYASLFPRACLCHSLININF